MGQILETIYDVLFKPRQAFLAIKEEPKPWCGFLIVVVNSVLLGIAFAAGDLHMSGGMQVMMSFVQLVINLLSWFFMTAVWHLAADLNGGKGQAKALLAAIGYCYFPQLLLLPVFLIAHFVSADAASGLLAFCGAVIGIWVVVLEVLAIQAVYGISGSKATLIFMLPIVALIVGILLFAVMVGMMAVSMMKGNILPPNVL